jgi:hypothetical protein
MRFGLVGIGLKRARGEYKSRRKMEVANAVISTTIHVTYLHVFALYVTDQSVDKVKTAF